MAADLEAKMSGYKLIIEGYGQSLEVEAHGLPIIRDVMRALAAALIDARMPNGICGPDGKLFEPWTAERAIARRPTKQALLRIGR
jgi:hypothetical protein